MSSPRWYRVDVREGPYESQAFFWQDRDGNAIQVASPRCMTTAHSESLREAIDEFRGDRQRQHEIARDGIVVNVSDPVELERADATLHHFAVTLNRPIRRAEEFLEEETAQTLYPIGHTWDWSRGPRNQLAARLRIFDRFGSVEDKFTVEEMSDDRLIERRLMKLWGDLLANRSHVLMQPILQSIREREGL